jgi:ATP-dependent exoDNAse (exonuclease V) beta subunit
MPKVLISDSMSNVAQKIFEKNNIQFDVKTGLALRSKLFTRDLLSLSRALLSLADKLAWLSLLRSPWCGLNLSDLLILSQTNDQNILASLKTIRTDSIFGI